MKPMRLAFVCGSYRGKTDNEQLDNILKARYVAGLFWERGFVVICPHTNSFLLSGVTDESVFLKGYKEIIRRMHPGEDILVVVPGAEDSEGAQEEISLARSLGITVVETFDVGGVLVIPVF